MVDRNPPPPGPSPQAPGPINGRTVFFNAVRFNMSGSVSDVQAAIDAERVVVFVKKGCSFCAETERLLREREIEYTAHRFDTFGPSTRESLKEITGGHATFPAVFFGGRFIGGCEEVMDLDRQGLLTGCLIEAGAYGASTAAMGDVYAPFGSAKEVYLPALFRFPHSVDVHAVRVGGALSSVIALVLGVFGLLKNDVGADEAVGYDWVSYATLIFCLDYAARLFGGSKASLVGVVAQLVCARIKPKFKPGPSKQFAIFIGTFMTLSASVFFFIHNEAVQYVGSAFLFILALFAGLEGFADWCCGCWIFSILIYLGIVKDSIYTVHINEKLATESAWVYGNLKHPDAIKPETKSYTIEGHASSPVDVKYKTKVEEFRLDNFDPIRHCKPVFFMIPLSLAACALALKVASESPSDLNVSNTVWHVVFVMAVVAWCVLALLSALRLVMYPKKYVTDLDCLERGNYFALAPMTLTLFAALIDTDLMTTNGTVFAGAEDLARVLYWIGSALTALVAFTRVAKWFSNRTNIDHVSPSWLIAPLGLLISTVAAAAVETIEDVAESDNAYAESGAFFFATAVMAALLVMPLSFQAFLFQAHGDDARRLGAFIWVAFFAILSPALDALTGTFLGTLSKLSVFASVALFIILCLTVMDGWLIRGKWTADYWAGGFSISAVAVAVVRYHNSLNVMGQRSLFSEMLAYAFIYLSCLLSAMFLLYTFTEVYRGKLFVSLQPYSPLAVMKLTHDAIRGAEQRLKALAAAAEKAGTRSAAYEELQVEVRIFAMLMWEHSRHEDDIIFKELDNILPGAQAAYESEHEELHKRLGALETSLKSGKGLGKAVHDCFEVTLPHLDNEEYNIQQLIRKNIPLALAKTLVRKIWETTDAKKMMEIVPWVINNLPREEQRIKYCRAWMDAMPERCHQIGRFVYLGVSPSTWSVLRMFVPEMIPRGLKGFTHLW